MLVRWLFTHRVYVSINDQDVNHTSFLKQEFGEAKQTYISAYSDINIYSKPIYGYQLCTVKAPLKQNYDVTGNFIINSSEPQYKLLFVSTNFNVLCNKQIPKIISWVYELIPMLIVIWVLRMIFLLKPITILASTKNFLRVIYTNKNGSILTGSSLKIEELFKHRKKPNQEYTMQDVRKAESNFTSHGKYTKYVGHNIWQSLEWIEKHDNKSFDFQTDIVGAQVRHDEVNPIISPPSHVKFYPDKPPTVEIPFTIDGYNNTIKITSMKDVAVPLGHYSHQVTELESLHMAIFREGMRMRSSHENFLALMKDVYQRLDYSAFCLFLLEEGEVTPVVEWANTPALLAHCESSARELSGVNKSSARFKPVTTHNFEDMRIASHIFSVESTRYAIVLALPSWTCILRSSEGIFHVLLSILTSFHHRRLKRTGDISSLGRMTDLWLKSGTYTHIECVGKPTTLRTATGRIYDRKVTQKKIDTVLNSSMIPLTWEKLAVNNGFQQFIVPFRPTLPDKRWMLLSGYYFKGMLGENVYSYIAEDITKYYFDNMMVNEGFIPGIMAAALLGLHRVCSDLRLWNGADVMIDFGLREAPLTFQKLAKPNMRESLDGLKKEVVPVTVIIGEDCRPIMISTIPSNRGEFYFFRNSAFMEAMPIIFSEMWKNRDQESMEDVRIHFLDLDTDTCFEQRTRELFVAPSQNLPPLPAEIDALPTVRQKITEIVSEVHKPDRELFVSRLEAALEGNSSSFMIRLESPYFFEWVVFNIQRTGPILTMLSFNIDHFNSRCLASIEVAQSIDLHGRLFLWIFEDANEPERVYTQQPPGQVPAIFNWTTISRNVLRWFRPHVTAQIEARHVDCIIQMEFETTRWFLFRGQESNGILSGVAIAIPTENTPPEVRPSKRQAKVQEVRTAVEGLKRVIPTLDTQTFDQKVAEIDN